MKKMNSKGFTLVELLAVITIMGVLMLVAIPAVSRTIENTRRDTFMNTAKSYINAIKNAVASDELYSGSTNFSALGTGFYYCGFDSSANSGKDLIEQGGTSAWGGAQVKGYVVIHKKVDGSRTSYDYAIFIVDQKNRGITTLTKEAELKRSKVESSSSVTYKNKPTGTAQDKYTYKDGTTDKTITFTGGTNITELTIG